MLTPDQLGNALGAALTGGGLTGVGFWAWLRWVSGRRAGVSDGLAAISNSQAAFQAALSEQAGAFTATLLKLTQDQQAEIAQLESRVLGLEDDNRRCHGENRQLRQMLEGLVRQLQAAGIDIPDGLRVSAILQTETADGAITAFTGLNGPRAKR